MKKWTDKEKLKYDLKLHGELSNNYNAITKMSILCCDKEIPLVIENPYNKPHYLSSYWCIKPSIIDTDRRENGDRMKKPTQYWFINCNPKQNIVFEPLEEVETRIHEKLNNKIQRSEIHPQYASRFIRQYLIDT